MKETRVYSVLAVSKTSQLADMLSDMLPKDAFAPVITAETAGEVRRSASDASPADIVVINTPLGDDFGIDLAIDLAARQETGIILIVKADIFEQVSFKTEKYGIVTLPKPTSKTAIYSAVRMLCAVRNKLEALEKETVSLRAKMEEIRLVNRAKWLLMDRLKMTEPEAHRYVEKQAMDRCVKKADVARSIIRAYEN